MKYMENTHILEMKTKMSDIKKKKKVPERIDCKLDMAEEKN